MCTFEFSREHKKSSGSWFRILKTSSVAGTTGSGMIEAKKISSILFKKCCSHATWLIILWLINLTVYYSIELPSSYCQFGLHKIPMTTYSIA